MSKVRVGFIGAGRISTLHALAYDHNPTGRLVALAEPDESLRRSQADAWSVSRTYANHAELLADPGIDAVEVLLPHNLHLPVALQALEAGKHVSLQKPMCVNMDEARQLISAAGESNRTFRVFENYRTYEPYMRAKELLDSGEIGDPLGIRVKTVHGRSRGGWHIPDSAIAWRSDPSQSGGAQSILDYGAHITSIVPYYLGPVAKVHAMADLAAGAEKFTGSRSVITWQHERGGLFGTWDMVESPGFVIDTRYYPVDEWVEITGSTGIIWITRCSARMVDLPPVLVFKNGRTTGFSDMETDWGDSFRRGGHEFTQAIVDGRQPQMDAVQAAHTLAFGLAAVRSAVEHREVSIGEL